MPLDAYYNRTLDIAVKEAHRFPAPVCSAPALVWHRGLWPQAKRASGNEAILSPGADPQDAPDEKAYNERLFNWVEDINATIRKLQLAGGATAPEVKITCDLDPAGLRSIEPTSLEFPVVWNNLSVSCHVTVQSDFATFSLFLNIPENEALLAGKTLPADHPFTKVRSALARITSPAAAGSAASSYTRDLFEGFWFGLRRDALSNAGTPDDNLFPGEAFTNIFGLTLVAGVDLVGESFDDLENDNAHSRHIIDNHRAFISQMNGNGDLRDLVICTMIEKRAIFISTLGADAATASHSHLDDTAVAPPVRYLVLVPPSHNRYELGRLVDHINTNGTLRMFALKEQRLFRRLGTIVRLYGHEVDVISAQFNKLLQGRVVLNQTLVSDDLSEFKRIMQQEGAQVDLMEAIGAGDDLLTVIWRTYFTRTLQTKLCKLESDLHTYSARFTGGMPFRVSRNNFYVRAFKERLVDLDVRPIPPYQSYDAFVRRRLFSSFNYISDIADRAAALRARLQQLLGSIQATVMVDLTHNINQLSKATAEQTQSLKKIQDEAVEETKSERRQQNILFYISVFVVVSQFISALLWYSWGEKDQAAASLFGLIVAFLLSPAVLWFWTWFVAPTHSPDRASTREKP